jgi:hypothetical protein
MIDETRQSIIRDNNTAQQSLEFLLDNVGPNTRDLVFGDVLYGDVDFSILANKGFRNVSKIHFTKPGKITSVINLPATLEVFSCPEQLLTEFTNTLPRVSELNLANNPISSIDFTKMTALKVLNLNDTRIVELKQLPETLHELYVNNTQVRLIDLHNTTGLKILHANGNKMLHIQNVPPSIVDLQIEDNPMVEVDYSAMPNTDAASSDNEDIVKRMDYNESLFQYFKLKHEYESNISAERRKAYVKGKSRKQSIRLSQEYRPKCIKCKRPNGTIFEQRDRRYIARCGNTESPCDLNIQLYRGRCFTIESSLKIFTELIEDAKENIIAQKLDTLFNYVSEEETAKLFKEQLKTYSVDNAFLKNTQQTYNELHNNPHKQELIRNKIMQIHNLKTTMNHMLNDYTTHHNEESLHTLTSVYVNEYLPEIHNLRLMKYEIMEMYRLNSESDWLFQRNVALHKNEHFSGEPPRVVAYRV